MIDMLSLDVKFELTVWAAGIGSIYAVMMRELWSDRIVQNVGRALAAVSFAMMAAFGWHAVCEFEALQSRYKHAVAADAQPIWQRSVMADLKIEHGQTKIEWNREDAQPATFHGSRYQ